MNIKKVLFSSLLLKGIFAFSLLILVILSIISYKQSLSLDKSTEKVIHTFKTSLELEQLFSFIKDAETGQRGFIITGDSLFLKPYLGALDKVNESFNRLKILTGDNLKQRNNIDTLYYLIDLRFRYLASSLNAYADTSFDKKVIDILMLSGNKKMENIREQIDRMVALELIYLKERQAQYNKNTAYTPLIILLSMLFALLIFLISYLKINKDLQTLESTNAKLTIAAETVKHAEEIGAFSCWQWDLEANQITSSDNQYKLLGHEPQSFKLTIDKFNEFVHPEDRAIIADGAHKVLNENTFPVAHFRVIRKDGEVRHFISRSKLITLSDGKKTLIGINSDVTEQYVINKSLEERNRELELSNKELASFNHVASHDLQEPLRIVQIYISRIVEMGEPEMPEKIKEYFDRIKMSVTRMRSLIDALLLFSKTSKYDDIFEETNLNTLLENSKLELAQPIEDKNAIINSVKLPKLNVISFQIQQLFTNLLSNSLKYSKPNTATIINIACKKIIAADQPELKTQSAKSFYKITISDNGIGFDEKYSESIFKLFYRLHQEKENEQPGTGIGLSICKKIVEKHGGFITATVIPEEGSTFSVYLPA